MGSNSSKINLSEEQNKLPSSGVTEVKDVFDTIKTTFTPTSDYDADKKRAENYAKSVGMDQVNTEMAVIMATQGYEVAGKAMIAKHTDKNGNLDYAAMRNMYG